MKKGQVTVFVILGIVLLIVASLLIAVRFRVDTSKPPIDVTFEGGLDAKKVHSFVTDCLSSVSKLGIEEVGRTGGNIKMEGLVASPLATYSDVLVFSPLNVPYWHYLKDCEQSKLGCMASNKPPLCKSGRDCVLEGYSGMNSIEEQLEEFVEENVKSCINNFKVLEGQVLVEEISELQSEVFIGDVDVTFRLSYPLKVTSLSSGTEEFLEMFSTKWRVNLKEIYELASDIIEAEDETTFFEAITLDLITVYSGLDEEKLPPTSELTLFGFNKKFWVRNEVEEMLMYDVLPYMQFTQFQNVKNYNPVIIEETDDYSVYEDGFWSLFDVLPSENASLYEDLELEVKYTYAPIHLRIGDSELIQPTSPDFGNMFFLKWINFLMSDYRFKYDLSYPLLIKITQDEAFDREGYDFYFAIEVNLRENVPMNSNVTPTEQRVPFMTSLDSSSQLIDRTITIETTDKHTGNLLEGVQVSYYCGYMFNLGETALKDGKAIWEGQLPFCEFGGRIIYEKFGYLGNAEAFNNPENAGSDKYFTFEVWPLQEKEVIIKKRTPENIENINDYGSGAILIYDQEATDLGQYEKIMFNINRNKSSSFETNVPTVGFLLYKPENASSVTIDNSAQRQQIEDLFAQGEITVEERQEYLDALDRQQTVALPDADNYTLELVPGTYFIEAHLLNEEPFTIPGETKQTCNSGCIGSRDSWGVCSGPCIDKEPLKLNETNISTWPSGGAIINFTLTENDVYNTDKVTFYVLEMTRPDDWDDMLDVESIDDYQVGKEYLLRPVFS